MKKLLSVILAITLILSAAPASALTVREFVRLYNVAVGEGFHLYPQTVYMKPAEKEWFLEPDQRGPVVVMYEPVDGADPLDYLVRGAYIRHKPRVSVGVFLNNVAAAAAALCPEIPEAERLAAIMCAMIKGDNESGYGYFWDHPVITLSESMGMIVYEETTEYQTFFLKPEG